MELSEPTDKVWCTTRESGDGWTMAAVGRALYGNDVRMSRQPTTDPRVELIRLERAVSTLAVDEGDMPLVMRSLRMGSCHGRYRKAGTQEWYEF